jgi:hypothetical protein
MAAAQSTRRIVKATAQEVLPRFGLAFVVDEHDTTWAITKSTDGPGLDTLQAGQRIQLTLEHHPDFSVVSQYDQLN